MRLENQSLFPDEGGPVILAVDVPQEIIDVALDSTYTWEQGLISFGRGTGLEQLQVAWHGLAKEIRQVNS